MKTALRNAIADAIDGSGSTPQLGDPQATVTEGSTGPGLTDAGDTDPELRDLD
jgi:hypothetical protein